jgi:flagellar export protein FliJ
MTRNFRFASILQLRLRDRDKAVQAVEEVKLAIRTIDDQLQSIQSELAGLDSEKRQALQGAVAITSLLGIQRHQLILLGNIQYLSQQRGKLLQESHRREYRLMKTQQAVKSMEKLQERYRLEALARDDKLLQSRLDEWSNTQAGRLPPSASPETSPSNQETIP